MDHNKSLPTELLFRILTLVTADSTSRYIEGPFHSPCAVLRAAAVVCKSWTAPAQELLWKRVTIVSQDEAEAFITSGAAGSSRTVSLMCQSDGETPFDDATVGDVLAVCNGLKEFLLGGFRKLGSDVLCLPSLTGVKLLDVENVSFLPSSQPTLPLPFALHTLKLVTGPTSFDSLSPNLVSALFQPSITSLDLFFSLIDPLLLPSLVSQLPSLLPHLSFLQMLGATPNVLPSVRKFAELEHLMLPDDWDELWNELGIPTQVRSVQWYTATTGEDLVKTVASLLRQRGRGESKLDKLDLRSFCESERGSSGCKELVEECGRRGIELVPRK